MMKMMTAMRLVLALLILPGFALSLHGAKKKEIPFIYLSRSKVLYVTVIDNVYDDGNVADRFYDIEDTLVGVFKEVDFPMDYKIVRFGSRVPKDQPEMQLVILKWGQNGLGEIEVRMNASLKETPAARNRNKLGWFRHSDGSFPIVSTTRTIAKYNEVLSKALMKLMAELNNHLELDYNDSNPNGSRLAPSLGTPVPDQ